MRDYEEKSFYEIQLDNKQLILVFLAAITVCVLIFVLGVMIGKGQKEAEMAALSKGETAATAAAATPDEDIKVPEEPQPVADTTSTRKQKSEKPVAKTVTKQDSSPPAAAREKRFAYQDLDKPEEPDADAGTTIKRESAAAANDKQPKAAAEAPAEKPPAIDSSSPQYTVQVMATSSRDKAEQQITALRAKGYKPFMDQKSGSNGTIYKVRIGRFADTMAARQIAGRLKQEMKLETWVTVLD